MLRLPFNRAWRRRRCLWRRHRTRKEEPSRIVPSNTIVRTYLLQYQVFRAMMYIDTTLNRVTVNESNGTFFQVMPSMPHVQSVAIGLRKENPPEIALVLDVTRSMHRKDRT